MFANFRFYLNHSLNDMRVNGRRTAFALLCIAAGVAAIVALQTVSGMISATLTDNLQATNRGDVQAQVSRFFSAGGTVTNADSDVLEQFESTMPFANKGEVEYALGKAGLAKIQAWLDENYAGQVEMTNTYTLTDMISLLFGGGLGATVTNVGNGQAASPVTAIVIDAAAYPYYALIRDRNGKTLAELITGAGDIVLDEKAAQLSGLQVGDVVQINGAEGEFTVRGIVPTDSEATDPLNGFFATQYGFYYLSHAGLERFPDFKPRVDTVYFKLADATQGDAFAAALNGRFTFFSTRTVSELRETNQQIGDLLNKMVTTLGLVGLLLGSIGIINTMQVVVQRRTLEIAVLKTLGLQAGQVTMLFFVEALLLGLIGSVLGIALGWLTTFAIKGVGESVVARPLPFRLDWAAALNGMIVGTLVTAIFGFLPTLSAGQIRPALVLRPNEQLVPRSGCLRTIGSLLFVIVAVAIVASTILGNFFLALGVTIGAFIGAGILYSLLMLVIWLVAKLLPAFTADVMLAKRQMLATKRRGAITLLALVVGVFSLSLTTLAAQSISNLMRLSLTDGGNVLVFSLIPQLLPNVEKTVKAIPGVDAVHQVQMYEAEVVGLERADGTHLSLDELKAEINAKPNFFSSFMSDSPRPQGNGADFGYADIVLNTVSSLTAQDVSVVTKRTIESGRDIGAEDSERAVLVLSMNNTMRDAGFAIGDKLIYRFANGTEKAFELIGYAQQKAVTNALSGTNFIPISAIPSGVQPTQAYIMAQVQPESISKVRKAMGLGTFVIEMDALNKLLTSLIGTFTAFPVMIALLGLIVGGVVIANSVALATLERRREIAVLKAIGLQRERVLGMLLLENALLGLVGGIIGVGLSVLGLTLAFAAADGLVAIPYGLAWLLMGLCVVVTLLAALTTAWSASGEKPLNVLRYE